MNPRTLITTYYGPGKGKNKPIVRITRGSQREEAIANISRHMLRNDYGAVVADVVDSETGELLAVATYHIGESFKVVFVSDVIHPICVTDIK